MEYDASAEMDELNRIPTQEFAIKAVEAIDAQNHVSAQEAGDDVRRRENVSNTLVNNLESKLHTQSLESSTQNSNFEATEADLHRRQCHAQVECWDYVQRCDEFRSESALLVPDRHRWPHYESLPALETTTASPRSDRHAEGVVNKHIQTSSKQNQQHLNQI